MPMNGCSQHTQIHALEYSQTKFMKKIERAKQDEFLNSGVKAANPLENACNYNKNSQSGASIDI